MKTRTVSESCSYSCSVTPRGGGYSVALRCAAMILTVIAAFVLLNTAASAQATASPPKAADNSAQNPAPSSGGETKPAPPTNAGGKKTDPADAAADKKTAAQEQKARDLEEKKKQAEARRIEYIEKTITYGTSSERKDSIRSIAAIKDAAKKRQLTDIMVSNLKSETDTGVIIISCRAAADLDERAAIPLITGFLDNESEEVRVDAVYALKKLKAKESIGTLVERLKKQDFTKDSNYTEAILQTLAEFEVTGEFEFVKTTIEAPETTRNTRLALILFLGNSKTSAAESYLLETFEDENEDLTTRAYAVNALSKIGATGAISSIAKTADQIDGYPVKKRADYYELYMHCVTALVKLGDKGSYEKLEKTLKSDNASMRLKAIGLMKELKDPRSIEILKYKAQYDPSDKVQAEAKRVLKETFTIDMEKKTGDSGTSTQNSSAGTDEKETKQ